MRRLISLFIIAGLALSVAQATTTTTPTAVSGTFTFTGNITVHEAVPEGSLVYCEVTLEVDDTYSTNIETITTAATPSGGSLYTCSPVIYYLWHLDTPTGDTVSITFGAGIGPSGATNTSNFTRTGTHSLLSADVPASGSSWGRAMGTSL